ncbi:MAG: 3-phosphoshikimate 1-carboxyvinyltransferase [Elusimicrobia bacterium]|nr:3-phosphoshikimate 1-carboxyvinyltransferase [Elusimicrobiota bacterium]
MQGNTNILIEKTPKIAGVIKAPPSKSYTHRAIMICSINGNCKIINPLYANDTLATINAWRQLGVIIKKTAKYLQIKGFCGLPRPKAHSIKVGESGTLLRFILPLVALAKGVFNIQGEGTLLGRSNRTIVEALKSWGLDIAGKGKDHKLPIRLESNCEIKGGKTFVSGKEGSQTLSALLIAASLAKEDTTIILKNKLVSRPYVDVTIDVLQQAGIKVKRDGYKVFSVPGAQKFNLPKSFIIHGDYSSAAFLIAAACLLQSEVTITDLINDKQGDKKIIDILNKMGARIKHTKNKVEIKGPFELKGINIDCGDTPDLVPVLAVLGCFAKGKTRINNISHLTYKESNRITAPAAELMKLGADISFTRDSITINQSCLQAGHVLSCNDHRIAMALVVAGLRIGEVRISGVECISKSYPDFLNDLKSLGANFKMV